MPQSTSVYPEPTRYLCLRAQACTPIPFDVYASKHMVPQITSVCTAPVAHLFLKAQGDLPRCCSISMPQSIRLYPNLARNLRLKAEAVTPILFNIYASENRSLPRSCSISVPQHTSVYRDTLCLKAQMFSPIPFGIYASKHKCLPRSSSTPMPESTSVFPDLVRHLCSLYLPCFTAQTFTPVLLDISATNQMHLLQACST